MATTKKAVKPAKKKVGRQKAGKTLTELELAEKISCELLQINFAIADRMAPLAGGRRPKDIEPWEKLNSVIKTAIGKADRLVDTLN